MKPTHLVLAFAAVLALFTTTSCDRDGNTGNGANDPTSQFETDKAMKAGDKFGGGADSTSSTNSVPASVDTTTQEKLN